MPHQPERLNEHPLLQHLYGLRPWSLIPFRLQGWEHIQPKKHLSIGIFLIEHGPYHCSLNNEPLTLQTGEWLIIFPHDLHEHHFDACEPGTSFLSMFFRFAGDRPPKQKLWRGHNHPREQVLQRVQPHLHNEFTTIAEQWQAVSTLERWRLQTRCLDFAAQLLLLLPESLWADDLQHPTTAPLQVQLHTLFDEHLNTFLSSEEIAHHIGLSVRHLRRRCQDEIGNTPPNEQMRFKMQRASDWLTDTKRSITDIAQALGFQTPYHFSRRFKHHTSVSPRTYRQDGIRKK